MTINQMFMEAYRNFEVVLKKQNITPKDYEDSIADSNAEKAAKIRLCRTVRNYLTHENTVFVTASQPMIDMLVQETALLDTAEMPVKKKMVKLTDSIHDSDLITSALSFMLRKKLTKVPVFNDENYAIGTFSFTDLATIVAAGNFTKAKKIAAANSTVKFNFIAENAPMSEVRTIVDNKPDEIFLIINAKSKVVGWISRECLLGK